MKDFCNDQEFCMQHFNIHILVKYYWKKCQVFITEFLSFRLFDVTVYKNFAYYACLHVQC